MYSQDQYDNLKNRLIEIYKRPNPPDSGEYIKALDRVNRTLTEEEPSIRPYDSSGLPGGILHLKGDLPSVIVPDIHARMDFFLKIMLDDSGSGGTILQSMASDALQVICVGDGVHGEKRAAKRWSNAFKEFETDYTKHENIDEEMKESFGVMEMIMEVKCSYPSNFHFLKGNHENIKNEDGHGNNPFIKYSYEGPMVAHYVRKFYGDEFLERYYDFEKNLPLFAIGKNFLVSHAEPLDFYSKEDIIEYRTNADVVEGLTWTADNAANDGSVQKMMNNYLENCENGNGCFYFGGHRPVRGNYNTRAKGKYVQFHNPEKFIIAKIYPDSIDLDRDIIELDGNIENIIAG